MARYKPMEATSFSPTGFGVTSLKCRVAAPPPLPLPLTNYRDFNHNPLIMAICDQFAMEFRHKAIDIMVGYGLPEIELDMGYQLYYLDGEDDGIDEDVDISMRGVPDEPWTGRPTLVIIAEWAGDHILEIWEKVVVDIKCYIDERLMSAYPNDYKDVEIGVEMIALELVRSKSIYPILEDENFACLQASWPTIKTNVLDILGSSEATQSHVTSISLFRFHYSGSVTTVYVSLRYESNQLRWPPIMKRVQDYLDGFRLHNLRLHMEHNLMKHIAFQFVPETPNDKRNSVWGGRDHYRELVDLGAAVGGARYITGEDPSGQLLSPRYGTLGCYLEVKTARYPKWKKVALASYHVARPAINGYQVANNGGSEKPPARESALFKADSYGFSPNAIKYHAALIEHPPRFQYNVENRGGREYVAELEAWKPGGGAEDRRRIDACTLFFDQGKQNFGSLWYGSGYTKRTSTNSRLDWALILPKKEKRVPKDPNILPVTWPKYSLREPSYPGTGKARLQPPAKGQQTKRLIEGLPQGEMLYKRGARTGPTLGYLSKFKTSCIMEEERHLFRNGSVKQMSNEYVVAGWTQFADHGDSGAVVFDRNGTAVGLLTAGLVPLQCNDKYSGIYTITPIEDMLEDIKAFSGGTIRDIRIPK